MLFSSLLRLIRPFQVFVVIFFLGQASPSSGQIRIDHTCCDASKIPSSWVEAAKSQFRVWYGHTSHGSQITSGMEVMNSIPFTFSGMVPADRSPIKKRAVILVKMETLLGRKPHAPN